MRELKINRIHDYPPKPEDAVKNDVYLNGKMLFIVTSNKYEIDAGHTYHSESLLNFLNNYLLDCMREVDRKEASLDVRSSFLSRATAEKMAEAKYVDAVERAEKAEAKVEAIASALDNLVCAVHGKDAEVYVY